MLLDAFFEAQLDIVNHWMETTKDSLAAKAA